MYFLLNYNTKVVEDHLEPHSLTMNTQLGATGNLFAKTRTMSLKDIQTTKSPLLLRIHNRKFKKHSSRETFRQNIETLYLTKVSSYINRKQPLKFSSYELTGTSKDIVA